MAEKAKIEGMLSPYRVLDLTDEKGLFCAKLLGDLGADVIKIEKPGGDPARNIGPFYHNEVDPEKSLFWWAFNTSKRGITLDIETSQGQETFKKLVKTADFVIESFPPGYLGKFGLGYAELEKIHPGIIMVSITPFGQTGPYKDYKAPDIVAWAMGGVMYQHGEPDRSPVRISHHSQAYLHAATEAAAGAMLALYYREMTGEGQQVDVSIQESVAQAALMVIPNWDMLKVLKWRGGGLWSDIKVRGRRLWPCKDGHVLWGYASGTELKRWSIALVRWMESEGMADDFLRGFDWDTWDLRSTTQEVIDRLAEPTVKFFMSHTMEELLEGSVKHRTMVFPMFTTADLLESIQLAARKFWVQLEHPELGTTITYLSAFTHTSKMPPRVSRRAPLIGEHNQDIYEELDTSGEELLVSRPARASQAQPGERRNIPKKLLEGIKVVDFSWNVTVPRATKTLAAYGAEVIKVESKHRLDVQRTVRPYKDGIEGVNRSGLFNEYNASKLSLTLNLAQPKGIEVARRLVAWADVVVENFAGGVVKRLGLGYEELKQIKPDIIMLSSCMQGQTGPHASHLGFGHLLTGLSGLLQIAGWPDREPANISAYTDFIAPHFNALAILAALDYRHRTGQGQYLDMSQYENSVHFIAPLILDYTVNGRVAGRVGNRYPYAAPHAAYRCRGEDRWCAIAVFTDEEWQSFDKVIGQPAWTKDSRFTTLSARKENEDELDKLVEKWAINHSAEEVMSLMQAAGVAAGVLQNGQDLLEHDPQLKHRHFYWQLDHPEVGAYRSQRPSFRLSKSACELRPAPLLGEQNDYVLKGILGMSDDEVAQLVTAGVIE